MSQSARLIGQLVQVNFAGFISTVLLPDTMFGLLEALDEACLILRRPDGEALFIPRERVESIRIIASTSCDPADTLLRAAEEPSEELLVRPAALPAPGDAERLLRPDY